MSHARPDSGSSTGANRAWTARIRVPVFSASTRVPYVTTSTKLPVRPSRPQKSCR